MAALAAFVVGAGFRGEFSRFISVADYRRCCCGAGLQRASRRYVVIENLRMDRAMFASADGVRENNERARARYQVLRVLMASLEKRTLTCSQETFE